MKKIYSLFLSVIVASGFYAQNISAITPSSATQGETLDVTITGVNTHFAQASGTSLQVHFSFEQASTTIVNSYTAINDLNLVANITLPSDVTVGTYDVTASNNIDGAMTLENSFTVNSAVTPYLWSDDFSDNTKWSIANSTDDEQDWVITNVSDESIGYGTGTWEDTDFLNSANNGYALFDSDIVGTTGGIQDATITLNETLDFSDNDNVVLEFNNRGRMWQSTQNFVDVCISNCNEDTSWVAYEVNAEETTSQLFENIKQVNISATAGNQSTVNLRFRYVGSWDYAWMVDEPRMIELVSHEIIAQSAWIFEENSGGVEFGRTPISQAGNSFEIGGTVYNFGAESQTNVTLDVNFTGPTSITSSESVALLENDSTQTYGTTNSLDLQVGLYEGTFSYSSDDDASGDNNVLKRNFEITDNVYSLDGIGVHPEEDMALSSFGPVSFGEQVLICAVNYSFKNIDTISSVRALLSTNSEAGAEIFAYILDSTSFFNGDFTGGESVSDLYTVTSQDITNGYVDIPVIGNQTDGTLDYVELNPGNYYVALELNNLGDEYEIRILDDQTVGQPAWSSAIFIAGEQAYTNSNAFAIRLITGNPDALGIEEDFKNFSMYPNPSSGTVKFNFNKSDEKTLTVRDISGKIVTSKIAYSNTEIDFNNYGKGVYLVNIESKEGSITEKVIIQ